MKKFQRAFVLVLFILLIIGCSDFSNENGQDWPGQGVEKITRNDALRALAEIDSALCSINPKINTLFKDAQIGVVYVSLDGGGSGVGMGSRYGEYVVVPAHVIEGVIVSGRFLTVGLFSMEEHEAEVVYIDSDWDVAVMKVSGISKHQVLPRIVTDKEQNLDPSRISCIFRASESDGYANPALNVQFFAGFAVLEEASGLIEIISKDTDYASISKERSRSFTPEQSVLLEIPAGSFDEVLGASGSPVLIDDGTGTPKIFGMLSGAATTRGGREFMFGYRFSAIAERLKEKAGIDLYAAIVRGIAADSS